MLESPDLKDRRERKAVTATVSQARRATRAILDQPVRKAKKVTLARLARKVRRAILANRDHKARKAETATAYPDRRATPDLKVRKETQVLKDRKDRKERREIRAIPDTARADATDLA